MTALIWSNKGKLAGSQRRRGSRGNRAQAVILTGWRIQISVKVTPMITTIKRMTPTYKPQGDKGLFHP